MSPPLLLSGFYPIVPDFKWLARLVPWGVKTIQLRLKDANDERILAEISASQELCKAYDCQLIVNDYWRQAIELRADMIHLGQEDLAKADLRAIKTAGLRMGLSTHSEAELETALLAHPDYIALGPIYETTLKVMRWSPQGLERIKTWRAAVSCPLVAIGGITLERALSVFDAGASSIAVVTDIMTHEKPEDRVKAWLKKISGKKVIIEKDGRA